MFLSTMKTTTKTTKEIHNRIRTWKTISAILSFLVHAHYLRSVLHPYSLLFLIFLDYDILKPQELLFAYMYIPSSFSTWTCVFPFFTRLFPYIPLYILGSTNSCIFLYCFVLCSFPFCIHATFSLSVICWQTSLGWGQFFGVVNEASIICGYKYFYNRKESSLGVCPEVQ